MNNESTLTPKAQQTREHILNTALELFASRGYSETTLRKIASEAGVSLGLTYRYFSTKEDLVFALYERLSEECVIRSATISPGTLSQRVEETIFLCLDQLQSHRNTLESLFSAGLSPSSGVAVLGERSSTVRVKMIEMYAAVISGSTDRLKPAQMEMLKTLLYALHMLIVFFWLQDRSAGQSRTRDLVRVFTRLLKYLKPVLAFKPVASALKELDEIITPMFGSQPVVE